MAIKATEYLPAGFTEQLRGETPRDRRIDYVLRLSDRDMIRLVEFPDGANQRSTWELELLCALPTSGVYFAGRMFTLVAVDLPLLPRLVQQLRGVYDSLKRGDWK